jgi:hypothetical protein
LPTALLLRPSKLDFCASRSPIWNSFTSPVVTSRCRLGILAAHKFGAIERGQPVLSAARHAGTGQVPDRSRLRYRQVRQEPPRRPHRRAAVRARVPGILGLPLPPRRDAGSELPRHQRKPDRARHRTAVPQPRSPASRGSRAVDPKTTICLTPPSQSLHCTLADLCD